MSVLDPTLQPFVEVLGVDWLDAVVKKVGFTKMVNPHIRIPLLTMWKTNLVMKLNHIIPNYSWKKTKINFYFSCDR